MSFDVVIVGAGCAGLGAAAALREAGLSSIVLEASHRVGGRAHTDASASFANAVFDRGASWLHAAERNPLVPIAQAAGVALTDSDRHNARRTFVGDRLATDAERAEFDASCERFEHVTQASAAESTDSSVADAIAPLRTDPWTATVETWEAAQIAAADPRLLSVQDLHRNQLVGSNLNVDAGLGHFVQHHLAPLAGEIRLGAPVSRITWHRAGGGVAVDTPDGTIVARACIVTVSTGVLAQGAIGFDPLLPADIVDAIQGLPMGLLTKIALRATDSDRFGLPDYCGLSRRVEEPFAPNISFLAWPMGCDHIVGFLGGHTAWSFAGQEPRATDAFAREHLRRLIGAAAERSLVTAAVTDWGTDPLFLGAYAYALPGYSTARDKLAEPMADGRLIFAGEAACTDGLAGTVGGAWNSGQAAAQTVRSALSRRSSTNRLATLP